MRTVCGCHFVPSTFLYAYKVYKNMQFIYYVWDGIFFFFMGTLMCSLKVYWLNEMYSAEDFTGKMTHCYTLLWISLNDIVWFGFWTSPLLNSTVEFNFRVNVTGPFGWNGSITASAYRRHFIQKCCKCQIFVGTISNIHIKWLILERQSNPFLVSTFLQDIDISLFF